MELSIKFSGWEEFSQFISQASGALSMGGKIEYKKPEIIPGPVKAEEPKKKPAKKTELVKAEEPKKTEEPTDPPFKAEEPEKAEPEVPKVDKVKLRRMLKDVNDKTGANTAKTWFTEMFDKDKFTDITDEGQLRELWAKAEEVLNA